jgi:hypothetical protein
LNGNHRRKVQEMNEVPDVADSAKQSQRSQSKPEQENFSSCQRKIVMPTTITDIDRFLVKWTAAFWFLSRRKTRKDGIKLFF